LLLPHAPLIYSTLSDIFRLPCFFIYETGISLSPFQISKAKEFTAAQGLESKMDYQVADAMAMPFKDNSFDLS
jgi:tocopherol O-methyltransferase